MPKPTRALDAAAVSRVIEMAWEDRTPFEAIKTQFGLDEAAVIALMRQQLKPGSFRPWRERVHGRNRSMPPCDRLPWRGAIGIRRATERRSAERRVRLIYLGAGQWPDRFSVFCGKAAGPRPSRRAMKAVDL